MTVSSEALKERTERFAIAVVHLCQGLPRSPEHDRIRGQLCGAASSIAANDRAACRAQNRKQFIAKLAIVVEEADESHLWLRVLDQTTAHEPDVVAALLDEANQLTAIFTASLRTAKSRGRDASRQPQASNLPILRSSTIDHSTDQPIDRFRARSAAARGPGPAASGGW